MKFTAQAAMWPIEKFLLVMKLTTLMLIIALVQASAKGYSQITLKEKNAPLEQVLNDIEKQTKYVFLYDANDIKIGTVTINVKNATLEETLNKCFQDIPIEFTIENNNVLLKTKQPTFIDKLKETVKAAFTNIDVTGRVLDEQGLPVASASVSVKGTGNGTITDARGLFTLKNVDSKAIIVISVIGYDKVELPAKNNLGDIRLTIAVNKLDEVQVIPYGESTQRFTVGNISSVSAKEIEEQPVASPLLTLMGRVTDLVVTQNSGVAGSGVTVRIQGQNSIGNGNDPFYVIDGVPYSSQMLGTTSLGGILGFSGGIGGQSGVGNPLNYINPSDIENIEVLKDADATSIYGSRAANGAILITTKKGKAGPMKVDVNLQQGYQFTSILPVMNTQQYLSVRREAFKNDGLIPSANPNATSPYVYAPDLMVWDTTRNINWQKTLLQNTAQYTNATGSISGGNGNMQYLFSGTYNRQGSNFSSEYADQRAGFHVNINSTSDNKKFSFQISASYLSDNNQSPGFDPSQAAIQLPPDAPALYNSDGSLNWALDANGNSSWPGNGNPLLGNYQPYSNTTSNLTSNALFGYKILPGLEISSSFGYNRLQTDEYTANLLDSYEPALRPLITLSANYSTSTIKNLIIEPNLKYNKVIGKGRLDALIGATYQQNNADGVTYVGNGYASESQLPDIKSATSVLITNSISSEYRYNALFGRINYIWDSKYIVDLTARRDGSSRFGDNNKFHDFWSAGGAWIFSEEKGVKEMVPFLSFGKLKASYGTTGSDQIADYQYLNLYNPINNGVLYQGTGSIIPTRLNNPNYQWEETKKLLLGLDFGFLKDRILLNISYTRNRSSNELLNYNEPTLTGFGSVLLNFPATVQNTSESFSLNTVNIKSKSFQWSSSLNLTIPHNELAAFPNIASSSYNAYQIGQPLSIITQTHFLGVNPATGIYQFADVNGNPASRGASTIYANYDPKYYGGFTNSFRYKGLTVDFLLQYMKKLTGFVQSFFPILGKEDNSDVNNYLQSHWQKPGDISVLQKYTTNNSSANSAALAIAGSDAATVDGSYARLKNVSLSYLIPEDRLHAFHIQTLRVYIQAQNLFTITNYPGRDPENANAYATSPMKVVTLGLQVGL